MICDLVSIISDCFPQNPKRIELKISRQLDEGDRELLNKSGKRIQENGIEGDMKEEDTARECLGMGGFRREAD